MRLAVPLLAALALAGPAPAAGLLIPTDRSVPPLAMVNHKVTAAVEDQVAITTVEQTFRNHTDRALEATFLFPIPRGASVDKFTMWVDGKETSGELLDAKKASQVYTDIVRRTQDPGLLEYLGNDLMRLRVFPVPPRGDQKVKLSFKSIAPKDGSVVEYVYPLRTDGQATRTLEEFSVKVSVKSQAGVQNVYSPTHAVTVVRKGPNEVAVEFERNQGLLDKDFQLFYGTGAGPVGLTPLLYKPVTSEDGYVMLLVSPQIDPAQTRTPRDLVLVLDTSSSMSELKMQQAKKAAKYCLGQLDPKDRFAVVKFSTTVDSYRDALVPAEKDHLERANKWVDDLRTSGGTAIWPALEKALGLRAADPGRAFTVIFFTDGQPTVDETNPDKIVKNVGAKNSANTRIFSFGVGDDVNAAMLDQLADATRGVSTYVRPAEDIGEKAAGLYAKISHPVMTDVRLTTGDNVRLSEVYPQRLPDLFFGSQLVVIGRYSGSGHAAVKLSGLVGGERKEFVYEVSFPAKTEAETGGKDFVEPLWARRKVGYLLDQIRANGEQKELVGEVVALAKRYGIATPYTSYLVVPDGPMPVAGPVPAGVRRGQFMPQGGAGLGGGGLGFAAPGAGGPGSGFGPAAKGARPMPVEQFARQQAPKAGEGVDKLAANRGADTDKRLADAARALGSAPADAAGATALRAEVERLRDQKKTLDEANRAFKGRKDQFQTGKLGVDLAVNTDGLRNQDKLSLTANRRANGRQVLEVGGVWIDDAFRAEMPAVAVKAQGQAYFRILEKQPGMKEVYRLGNYVVWVSPSGTALVIDPNDGKEELPDADIDALFAAKK
ncbi:MAG: VIT and VWA domain-containing protein [Gemmataceae bacterium]|nr:VIT and VWA domain-containing protein [Gemmataceae bacterium]